MPPAVPIADIPGLPGTDLGRSDWLQIDQSLVDAFAEVTNDHQFIHVDPVAAARTAFGSTIAHGFLTLSLVSTLFYQLAVYPEGLTMTLNYGMNKLRFLAPVKVGGRIRLKAAIADAAERSPGAFLFTYDITVEIEGEERPALVGQLLALNITAG